MEPAGIFVAILADLVSSREVPNRAELQRDLKQSLQRLRSHQPVSGARVAGPDITAGDEVQLLLRVESNNLPGHATLAFLRELTEDLQPVRISFGIGLGALSTGLEGPIRELDGPCFHRARQGLESAKREGRWAVISGMPSHFERAANSILRLTGDIRGAWTDRQREIVRMRRTMPLQKDVAQKLDVSPSVVSEVLRAARHDAVLEAEEAVVVLINRTASPQDFPPQLDEPGGDT